MFIKNSHMGLPMVVGTTSASKIAGLPVVYQAPYPAADRPVKVTIRPERRWARQEQEAPEDPDNSPSLRGLLLDISV
jgi:hypothetical protein